MPRPALLLLLALSASTARAGAPFGPGEKTVWQVSYLGLPAGTATLTVGLPMELDGETVWPVVGTADSSSLVAAFPVHDRFATYWQPESKRPLGFDFFADENRRRRREKARFNRAANVVNVTRQKDGAPSWNVAFEVPAGVTDLAAAALSVRDTALEPGQTIERQVFTGQKTFGLVVKVTNRSTLRTALGPTPVVRLEVTTAFDGNLEAKRPIVIYVSDDGHRVPVRVEAELALGTVLAEVTQYLPGRD